MPYAELMAQRSVFEPASRPGDLLAIMYTSGTTANAKGCMLSTGYYVAVGRAYGLRRWVVPGDRMYTGFPMFHTSGQHGRVHERPGNRRVDRHRAGVPRVDLHG